MQITSLFFIYIEKEKECDENTSTEVTTKTLFKILEWSLILTR